MSGYHPTPPPAHSDYRSQAATHFQHGSGSGRPPRPEPRWNTTRDVLASALLLAALLLPWNIHFGVGVPGSAIWLYVIVGVVTVLSLASLLSGRLRPDIAGRLRNVLAAPYLAVVACFAGFAIVEAVRFGGAGDVPAGVGPGVIIGLGGALLAAQPPLTSPEDSHFGPWMRAVKLAGIAAMVLATLSVVFNLYWRTRYVLPHVGNADFGSGNLAVVATTIAYGLVALVAVLAGLRWLIDRRPAARLTVTALGVATALASVVVWSFSIGRDIDAFHGIAQTTSTAAVGFEGYLTWVAAAAILGPLTLRQLSTPSADTVVWRDAVRKCLALIAIWFVGCAILRVFDLVTTASLDLPLSPYDSIGLLAFDIVAAAVAVWVRFNIGNSALHPAVVSALCAVLFVLSVCRVAVGVGLAPRILYSSSADIETAVYGNSLAQQITSTFDVVMCWLALAVAAIALLVLQLDLIARPRRTAPADPPAAVAPAQQPGGDVTQQLAAPTQQLSAPTQQSAAPTVQIWSRTATERVPTAAPRIARTAEGATQQVSVPPTESLRKQTNGPPKIARLLEESTQRFAAGTTYTGQGRRQGTPPDDSLDSR